MLTNYLPASDLAKILHISRIAVYKKIKDGQIKAVRLGRNFFIDKNNLPEITGQNLGSSQKKIIDRSVNKTVREYGETLKLLGKE
jgi:excisionase family DNA binding protein